MKSRNERLWDAYCARLASGWCHEDAWDALIETVDYFDAHCPREDASTPAWVPLPFNEHLNAPAAGRINWGRPDLESAQSKPDPVCAAAERVAGASREDKQKAMDMAVDHYMGTHSAPLSPQAALDAYNVDPATKEWLREAMVDRLDLKGKIDYVRQRCRSSAPLFWLHTIELPRELGSILEALQQPDPVRAAAVAYVDERANYLKRIGGYDLLGRGQPEPTDPFDKATKNLLDAVAAERGESAEIMANPKLREALAESDRDVASGNLTNGDLLRAAESRPAPASWLNDSKDDPFTPAPNWRALVIELREACAFFSEPHTTLGIGHSGVGLYVHDSEYLDEGSMFVDIAPLFADLPALIAALDKPEGDATEVVGALNALRFEFAAVADERDELRAALEATRKECGVMRDRIDREQKLVFQWEREHTSVAIALEATRKELAEANENVRVLAKSRISLVGSAHDTHRLLGAMEGESIEAAARRVVAERDEALRSVDEFRKSTEGLSDALRSSMCTASQHHARASALGLELDETRTERDTLKSQLAARDELRDAAVEYVEASVDWNGLKFDAVEAASSEAARFRAATKRVAAARDAAQKAGA